MWITTNWKILKEMVISDHLTCFLRNMYAGQEVQVRTGHGTRGWFQIGKGVHQGCTLSPCLFNLYEEYIMKNAGLEEAYKLNKHGDNIQPWRISFPIWNQSVVPCPVLTVPSWPAYRFLRRQVRKEQLELDMEQLTDSKSGKKYIKVVYCHSASLTYMQRTSCEMPG